MCYCKRHPHKRIKYLCETDQLYMCSICKKDHEYKQHVVVQFRVDYKRLRQEIKPISKDYQRRFGQLVSLRDSLDFKMSAGEDHVKAEIDRMTTWFNLLLERLTKRKLWFIDDLKKKVALGQNTTQEKLGLILKYIAQSRSRCVRDFKQQSIQDIVRRLFRNSNMKFQRHPSG
mmetsp:Transcript_11427/g.12974  ORF Transcript_11427/g.12974 Transcript_11427/m.12974 type:complete len:173 (+) Transcript_11427:283-801(+)